MVRFVSLSQPKRKSHKYDVYARSGTHVLCEEGLQSWRRPDPAGRPLDEGRRGQGYFRTDPRCGLVCPPAGRLQTHVEREERDHRRGAR